MPISSSLYEESAIAEYQTAHAPERPLKSLSAAEQDQALVEICKEIKKAAGG
ncbi:hypothetical protein QGP82_27740 [Leptothoe sp. LEGE 181152]|nr:hypothetical protein [Leptothoe sp. LEGE 181152]